MLILPLSADQPFHAQRCVELGAGISLAAAEINPEAIRDAVRELLANPLYRAGADQLQREIAMLPGPAHAVALLAELAEVEALAA
jgi:N-glycosyltransferase